MMNMMYLKHLISFCAVCVLCLLCHIDAYAQSKEHEIDLNNVIISADSELVQGKATLVCDEELLSEGISAQVKPYSLYVSIKYLENRAVKGVGVYKLDCSYTLDDSDKPSINEVHREHTFELVHIAGEVTVPRNIHISGSIDINGDEENGIIDDFATEGTVDAIALVSDEDSALSDSTFVASAQYTLATNDVRSGTVGTVIVPENSRIQSFVTANFRGTQLVCYDQDVRFGGEIEYALKPINQYSDSYYQRIQLMDNSEIHNFTQYICDIAMLYDVENNGNGQLQLTMSEYDYIQSFFEDNYTFYYNSAIAQDVRNVNILLDNGDTRKLVPSYFLGEYVYELNGGMNHKDNTDSYYIGSSNVLHSPTRKDYRFCGWYTDEDFTEDCLLNKNEFGEYYITKQQANGDKVTLYARWEFFAIVDRKGIQYQITADHTAAVAKGVSVQDAEILNTISYKGNQYPVTTILKNAYNGCQVTTLSIPENITKIEKGAFSNCNLKEVYIDSLSLDIDDVFHDKIHLYAYAMSDAYLKYEAMGYKGQKNCYSSNITYILNGGENHKKNPPRYNWKSVLILYEPTKEDCRFDGWYTDSSFQKASKVEQLYGNHYEDIVLYAKFTPTVVNIEEELNVTLPHMESEGADIVPEMNNDILAINKPYVKKVSLKNIKGKKLKITIKASDAKGYHIKYSTNKKLKNAKTIHIQKTSYTKKLKKNKTYYVKVRAYNTNRNGTKVYSDWSKIKKITIKK